MKKTEENNLFGDKETISLRGKRSKPIILFAGQPSKMTFRRSCPTDSSKCKRIYSDIMQRRENTHSSIRGQGRSPLDYVGPI